MKLCHPLIHLAIFIGLTAAVCGQAAVKPNPASSTDALPDLKPGVVVDELKKNSAADRAGIQVGDVILRWSRGDANGPVASPFDLSEVEIEQAPRGPVTVEGLRGTEKQSWTLGTDHWEVQARPNFQGGLLDLYREGQQFSTAGKAAEAAARWRAMTTQSDGAVRVWFLARAGDRFAEGHQWKEADAAYQEAVEKTGGDGPRIIAQLLRAWAGTFNQRSDWENTEKYYLQSTAERRKLGRESLMIAMNLDSLGVMSWKRGDLAKAEEYHRQSLYIRQKLAPESLAVASSLNGLGNVAEDQGDLAKAEEYYRQALEMRLKLAPGSLDVASSFNNLGNVASDRGDLAKAEEYYRQALEIREKLAPGSLAVGGSFNNLGNVAYRQGDLTRAEECYRQALEIKEKLAPGSLSVASTLANLGNVAHDRGDLGRAEEYYRRDLEITEKLAPGSLDFAGSLMDLGIVAQRRGDLARAEEYYRRALEIKQKLAPGSLDVAYTLNNLGSVARDRRDLVHAEMYYRQALETREKLAPGSLDVAQALHNLGEVALDRDDLTRAEEYNRQALAIKERLAPGSLDVASTLDILGIVYWKRGDFTKTEEYCRRALEIREAQAPGSLEVALSLDNLGAVAWRRGDLPKAEDFLQRGLAIREKFAPVSVNTAEGLNLLSAVVRDRGDLDRAEQYYRRALGIWEKLAPASANKAESLTGLASIMRQRGQPDSAIQLYERALTAFEGQTTQLGGADEVRAAFRSGHLEPYREYLDLLITQNRPDLAFQVLERSRARTLLETLATARVDIRHGAGATLRTQERLLQAEIKAKSDRRILLLSHEHSDDQITVVEKEISDLVREYQDLKAEIRFSSPVYAALTQPQPLTAREVQQRLLDDDTLLLEYSLGEERSYVFAVTPGSLAAYELPKRAEIERMARSVYDILIARNHPEKGETEAQTMVRSATAEAQYPEAAGALSRMILGPVASLLQKKRLLIVSDGVLQYIPFAALPSPGDPASFTPLVVNHEIVSLPSASVLDVLRKESSGRARPPKTVAVLADPVFDAHDLRVRNGKKAAPGTTVATSRGDLDLEEAPLLRSAAEVGAVGKEMIFGRLLFSRQEANAILKETSPGKRMKALGFAASRATATNPNLAGYRIVHFATHGLLNSEHPELSGLVLSLVDERGKAQAGFLELADIYNLNLPVDMVVLSACETGLGKEIRGEGLVGLTRGFMYAGATRVVASLWRVDDAATAELMGRFYKGILKDGLQPAAALQNAQVEMRKLKRWSAPHYWAGFVMQGQW